MLVLPLGAFWSEDVVVSEAESITPHRCRGSRVVCAAQVQAVAAVAVRSVVSLAAGERDETGWEDERLRRLVERAGNLNVSARWRFEAWRRSFEP